MQILKATAARQVDIDDRLRAFAVTAICEIGIQQQSLLTTETLNTALGRLLDSKASVRKAAGSALGSLFKSYVCSIAEGATHCHQPSFFTAYCAFICTLVSMAYLFHVHIPGNGQAWPMTLTNSCSCLSSL